MKKVMIYLMAGLFVISSTCFAEDQLSKAVTPDLQEKKEEKTPEVVIYKTDGSDGIVSFRRAFTGARYLQPSMPDDIQKKYGLPSRIGKFNDTINGGRKIAWYYDTATLTAVYVFETTLFGKESALLDNYVVSTVNFVATKPRD